MSEPTEPTIETIVTRTQPDGAVEVLTAPPLSAIAAELLDGALRTGHLRRDLDAPDVLIFPGGYRYLIGDEVPGDGPTSYLLHRLP